MVAFTQKTEKGKKKATKVQDEATLRYTFADAV